MSKFAAVYIRVSSKKQDLRSQEPDLKRWAEAQAEPVKTFTDKFTGKRMDRPGWQALEAAIAAGEVSTVVVWRLDRLGRTAKGLTALFEFLRQKGVNLVSLKDGLDLSTPAGRLMANVLASVAQFETEARAERVAAGQAAARAAGKTWGGSKKGRRLTVTAEQVETVQRLKAEGKTVAAIARATALSRPTVYRLLAEVPTM
jgi:DNA invertase Pin-like site-specific DNA recombinase